MAKKDKPSAQESSSAAQPAQQASQEQQGANAQQGLQGGQGSQAQGQEEQPKLKCKIVGAIVTQHHPGVFEKHSKLIAKPVSRVFEKHSKLIAIPGKKKA